MAFPVRQAIGAFVEKVNGGTISPAWPTHQAGDIGLLIIETSDYPVILATPAGFEHVPWSPQKDGSNGASSTSNLYVFWKRAASAAEASPVVPVPVGTSQHARAVIVTVRGCSAQGVPWDIGDGDIAAAATTSVTFRPLTTAYDDALIMHIVSNSISNLASQGSGWANANLANLSEWVDSNSNIGGGSGLTIITGQKAVPGNTGSTTGSLGVSSRQGRIVIAFTEEPQAVDKSPYRGLIGTDTQGAPGTISPPWPTHAAGDIGILVVEGGSAPALSVAQGFTQIGASLMAGSGSSGTGLAVYWKRATGSSEPAPTVAEANDHTRAVIFTIKGAKPSGNPIHAFVDSITTVADGSISLPDLDTTTRDCLIVGVVTNSIDTTSDIVVNGWTKANLEGVAEIFDQNQSVVSGSGIAVAIGRMEDPGNTGNITANLSSASHQAKKVFAIEGLAGEVFLAETGEYTSIGNSSDFLQHYNFPAETGEFTLTGFDADFPIHIHENIQAEVGVFQLLATEAIFRTRLVGWSKEVPLISDPWTKQAPPS